MTALQQHDVTAPHPALDWPIEVTEFALIGDQLAEELDRSRVADDESAPEQHWGTYVWTVGDNAVPWTLVGTTVPGGVHFEVPELTNWWADVPQRDDPIDATEWTELAERAIEQERGGADV